MPTPTVDVITGNVTNGPVKSGQTFEWTCSQAANNTAITVYANNMPSGKPWFQYGAAGQVSFTTPSASAPVTAEAISPIGGWKWTASGVVVGNGAHVNVSGSVPKAKAS